MISKEFGLAPHPDKVDFINHLALEINSLILHDFPRLVNILYRIDVSESRLKELLSSYIHDDAGYIVAQLIIERQIEKIKSRNETKKDQDISADDEWNQAAY